jgi:hypothetical protein
VYLTNSCASRLKAAKVAYSTRRARLTDVAYVDPGAGAPRAGDLVLAEVVSLGQHKHLERPDGRRAHLFVQDEVVVCYGNRYAPDQFEAEVPDDLGPCHLVAAGGLAARVLSRHNEMAGPTCLAPLGLLVGRDGEVLNLRRWALPPTPGPVPRPVTVAVVGTSMNAGKTTTAGALIRGFSKAGRRVGAAKITGTGAGGDVWVMRDAGATHVLDFTDVGFASTYKVSPSEVLDVLDVLIGQLAGKQAQVVVLEVSDGIFQQETAALLAAPGFRQAVDGVVFASPDAIGAVTGVSHLRLMGLPVICVSGRLTSSPLAVREAAGAVDLPVLAAADLRTTASAAALLGALAGTATRS